MVRRVVILGRGAAREIVDGLRPKRPATTRNDSPAARPNAIRAR